MAEKPAEILADLLALEADLKRLEAEYNMFFAGRLKRPPWETRSRVDAAVRRLDRTPIVNYADRFRFSTLQARFAAFIDLWDRGLRAREEGRPGPFAAPRAAAGRTEAAAEEERVLHVTKVKDPLKELDKLRDLYNHLVEARSEGGLPAMPFHKFAELVKTQVSSLREKGSKEVSLQVTVRGGKVALTARPVEKTKKPSQGKG